MSYRQPHHRVVRALSSLLIAGQVLATVPVSAAAPAPAAPAAPPAVTVNRTVPDVEPVPQSPVFSAEPSDDELFRARVFGEPMVPTGAAAPGENRALAQALSGFLAGSAREDFTPITRFLETHPDSPWRLALLTNLGVTYRDAGYFTRALQAWKEAWELGKDETEPQAKAMAERALTEYLHLNMLFGRHQVLEPLLDEVEGRDIGGAAGEKINWAKRGLWLLKNKHEMAIPSGPTALDRILALGNPDYVRPPEIAAFHPTFDGASLTQMDELARSVGLTMRMAFREGEAEIPLPALVHLKAGHYSAIVREEGGSYLLHDPILGQEIWMSRKALAEEASGYFMVPGKSLPRGWRAVQADEGEKVRGKCAPCTPELEGGHKRCQQTTSCEPCKGMAVASFHLLLVNLTLNDSPVGYSPSRGPSVHFEATYNHREILQPAIFTYSNLGPKWTFNWLSYVQDNPANLSAPATVYAQGGGHDIYSGFSGGSYAPDVATRSVLVRTSISPIRYEHRLADGTVQVFAQADGASTSPRRTFLTEIRDPQGQTLAFTYDASLRLVAATDALGQVSTVAYEDSDPLKITKVTDPFERFARFEYTAGKLTRITDVMGLTSDFTYEGGDFINSMTTPYGTWTFAQGLNGPNVWAETTDPMGGKERVEYGLTSSLPTTEPAAKVPTGFTGHNQDLHAFISLYWTKRALMLAGPDPTVARQTRWLRNTAINRVVPIAHSRKEPLENRVWYAYPGQTNGMLPGTQASPSKVARVLDDGQTQLRQYEYNLKGMAIREIDPVGRETVNAYGENNVPDVTPATGNGIDLLQVKVKNLASPGGWDVTSSSTYNSLGEPLTITDAAGQTTAYTYLTDGRVESITTPARSGITENRTTAYTYDPVTGNVASVSGPGGVARTYTYDTIGRLRVTTDSANYTLTYDYDNLDRQTKITYPDGTFEETVYDRLDPVRNRDRLGRWNSTFYDALQRIVATRDAEGRTISQQWCPCGDLETILDGKNNPTRWERDLQGRTIREVRVDGTSRERRYESATSRLKSTRDPKGQEVHWAYALDGAFLAATLVNAVHPTPGVTYDYLDPATGLPDAHGRLRRRIDGTGTTTYAYHPIGGQATPGAGQLASIDGPLPNDTIGYTYDALDRPVSRTLNGTATTWSYDPQGRTTSMSDPLGTFTFAYAGSSRRIASITYPNGMTSAYTYLPAAEGHRLSTIQHTQPNSASLLALAYTYDANGNTTSWARNRNSSMADRLDIEYDRVGRLTAATLRTQASPASVLKRYRYTFDAAGNRTGESNDDQAYSFAYDAMNQLRTRQPVAAVGLEGGTSEPALVSAGTNATQTSATNTFALAAPQNNGHTVEIVATDYSGNSRSNTYQMAQTGSVSSFTHDAAGNLITADSRSFEWDVFGRLIAVKDSGVNLATFTYDANGRRATKTTAAASLSYVHDDDEILEIRSTTGSTTRYVYGPGTDMPLALVENGTPRYLVSERLGSVAYVVDEAGTVVLERDYDPWGNPIAGGSTDGYGFTGREWDAATDLYYYRERYYDPRIAVFLSQDPLGPRTGVSLYEYAGSNPTSFTDPSGLERRLDGSWMGDLKKVDQASKEPYQFWGPTKQCVSLTRNFTGLPETAKWREGEKIFGNLDAQFSTAIATFGVNGRYPRDDDTMEKNSGIYLEQLATGSPGILIIDQFPKPERPGQKRPIYNQPSARRSNRASAYSIILCDC